MQIHEITTLAGAHKRRKRVGRGESSGAGKSAGRGNKGDQSRTGGGARVFTMGGQLPIFRRLPKRGFNNFNFRTEYRAINLDLLAERFTAGESVTVDALRGRGLISGAGTLVKVLGRGELPHKLTLEVHAISRSAREAVEKVGGTVRLIERKDPAALAKAKRNSKKSAKGGAKKTAAKETT